MKIQEVCKRYKVSSSMFRCPLCYSKTKVETSSVVCKKNHCFDISKYGYINFLPSQQQTKYTKELFESRRYIFEKGLYNPLKESIVQLLKKYCSGTSKVNMLDIGCGEGFYSRSLIKTVSNLDVYAMDNSRDAIVLGAKKDNNIKWFIGDLANIPLASETMDILLDIFTPSNYSEFSRVLKDTGYLFKIVPSKNYLKELRTLANEQLLNKEYSNLLVVQYFKEHMQCVEMLHLEYSMPVSKEDIDNLYLMTPMMFNVEKEKLDLSNISSITLDFDILVGKKKPEVHKKHKVRDMKNMNIKR
ncbi:MAG: methyltransferase domain-containing protein [Clostridia bacterium]